MGTFQAYYQTELLSGYSESTVSWITSLQIFFIMGLGPFVGIICDRYGPRLLMVVGTILHVFGIMMTSLGTQYYQILLAQGVCSAIGAACIFQPGRSPTSSCLWSVSLGTDWITAAMTCVAGWFNKKRGAAFGILTSGSSLGGVVYPIMVTRLVEEVGFPWAMRTCGFLILFLMIIAIFTIRPFSPPQPHPVTRAQLVKPLKEPNFLLLLTGFVLLSYGFFAPINYLPSQAISAGMSTSLAQYLVSMFNAGSLIGRLVAGFLADKVGRYNCYIVVCYMSGIWILALWLPASGDASLIAFAVLFGFFSGAYVSLITPLVMAISPFKELGFRTGIVLFMIAIAGLTTNPINGAIVEGSSGWNGLKIFSGVFFLAGTTFVLVLRLRLTGWKLARRF